jgi:hypothetical protein
VNSEAFVPYLTSLEAGPGRVVPATVVIHLRTGALSYAPVFDAERPDIVLAKPAGVCVALRLDGDPLEDPPGERPAYLLASEAEVLAWQTRGSLPLPEQSAEAEAEAGEEASAP